MAAAEKTASDGLHERIVSIRRTSATTKGGRRFSIVVLSVVGDGKGRIGVGLGSASEVPPAVEKAMSSARRNMRYIPLNGHTLFHQVTVRFGATKIFMKPAFSGTGIIAGPALRSVMEVLGISDVMTKITGSTNPINVVYAAIKGLMSMTSPDQIAARRGKSVHSIAKRMGQSGREWLERTTVSDS